MSSEKKIRVRFAPSPTGPLHIGGVRTALYNYLFARKEGGDFLLRIEDTDQKRYVEGAEEYIIESLSWLGISPDEGPVQGGIYGPYRQSERKGMYKEFCDALIENGYAYIAFDSEEALDEIRQRYETEGKTFRYDSSVRDQLDNSLKIGNEETTRRVDVGESYVVRMLIPENESVTFYDLVRNEVTFDTNELDDKVIMKADGLPTYHLANVVDDYHMKISHVIRGEEWISSTAHHVLLYRMLGWEASIPQFVHLPLILKPGGGGKLSKRDGQKLNMPVFPMQWHDDEQNADFQGFREEGFFPEPTLNFLALLGWSPGDDREVFGLNELIQAFSLEQISSGGARFDIQKARWFNQQYLIQMEVGDLLDYVEHWFPDIYALGSRAYHEKVWPMFQERIHLIPEFVDQAGHFYSDLPDGYDEKQVRKRVKEENRELYQSFFRRIIDTRNFDRQSLKDEVEGLMEEMDTKFGVILPVLRLAIAGTLQGPDLFEMMEVLGRDKVTRRLDVALEHFFTILKGE